MTALAADRGPIEHLGPDYSAEVYQSSKIYMGSIVCMNSSGYAVKGSTSTSLIALGVANAQADNSSGSDGDISVSYREGVFSFGNSSGADEITEAERGQACYIVDDQTVAKTDGTGTRSVAGCVVGLDEFGGVMVRFGNRYVAWDGDLVAANNLSDVDSAATARANLGANLVVLTVPGIALDAAEVYYIQSPVAGDITSIRTGLRGAITTGDPTITASIDGTPVTTGVVTIEYSGSAAGDKDSCTPSAANTVAAGENIELTVAPNSQDTTEYCDLTILIET
jgi:hypothetical protein